MKNLKLLSVMVISGLLMAGCGNIDNADTNNDNSNSTTVQNESQSDVTKTESLNSDTASTESITYDKAGIEEKLKETEVITEECISNMKWSPDGNELIYYTDDGQSNYDVYLWEKGKEQPKKVNIDIYGGISFGWSPNSEYVLIDSGTFVIRNVTLINKYGDGEIFSFEAANIEHPNMDMEQLWSDDSTKIAFAKYNDEITVLNAEVSGVFDIVVYDVNSKTEKTILKSTATEYFTIEKWVDNDTISCNKYTPQNGELGSVVEKKNININ